MRALVTALLACAVSLALAAPASPHPGHGAIEVDVGGFAYAPKDVSIYQGDSIIFTWKGPDTNHSATGDTFDTDAGKSSGQIAHAIGDTTATITVQAVAGGSPVATAPVLTKVRVSPRKFTRKTTLTFNLDWPASMRATLRKGARVAKEVDFNAVPGDNNHGAIAKYKKRYFFASKS